MKMVSLFESKILHKVWARVAGSLCDVTAAICQFQRCSASPDSSARSRNYSRGGCGSSCDKAAICTTLHPFSNQSTAPYLHPKGHFCWDGCDPHVWRGLQGSHACSNKKIRGPNTDKRGSAPSRNPFSCMFTKWLCSLPNLLI